MHIQCNKGNVEESEHLWYTLNCTVTWSRAVACEEEGKEGTQEVHYMTVHAIVYIYYGTSALARVCMCMCA